MKKILGVLGLFLVGIISYSKIEDTAFINVTGEVLDYVELKNVSNLDFGDVVIGAKKVPSEKNAKLEIIGENYNDIELQWAVEGTGKYQSIKEPLSLNMKKGNEGVEAKISLANSSEVTKLKTKNKVKTLEFKGEIPEVPNVSEGIYEGTFVVRYIVGNEN